MVASRGLKSTITEYVPESFTGTNQSGIRALNDTIVVMVDVAPEKTAGGIFIPEKQKDNYTMASETGIVVDVGPGAFKWDRDRTAEWEGRKPGPGDHVAFERYAGQDAKGEDGKTYRIMQDKAIACVLEF